MDESLSTNGLNYKSKMDLFICGYLKKLSIYLSIPLDVISIIKKMYSKETIHLLKAQGGCKTKKNNTSHYCISLEDILQTI